MDANGVERVKVNPAYFRPTEVRFLVLRTKNQKILFSCFEMLLVALVNPAYFRPAVGGLLGLWHFIGPARRARLRP